MKHTLVVFYLIFCSMPLYCDNTRCNYLSRNPIQHSRTKHIYIKHHFIRDLMLKGEISLDYIATKDQVADISQKHYLRIRLNPVEIS